MWGRILAGLLLAVTVPTMAPKALAQLTNPTHEQCHANLPDNAVYFNTCPAETRNCPNYSALGVDRCLKQTPAELAAAEREAAQQQARADAQRIIESDRLRQVEAETARLGAHRRAEAERLVQMRIRAAEAQGRAERAEQLAQRLAAMTPQDRAAYERCREIARAGRVTCQ